MLAILCFPPGSVSSLEITVRTDLFAQHCQYTLLFFSLRF